VQKHTGTTGIVGSVVDPELFIPDSVPTSEEILDPDHTVPVFCEVFQIKILVAL
jgi:hypothetical protein